MTTKEKRQRRQDKRDIKAMNDIVSGRVKVALPEPPKKTNLANRIGGAASVEEQGYLAECYIRLLRFILPGIMAELSLLDDSRDQSKVRHSLPALMLYGILIFLCHIPSRRAANREIGGSRLSEMMSEFVPEFKSMPHADTLERLLENINTDELEAKYESFIKGFIASPQFSELNPGRFLIAIDGTMKFTRSWCWDSSALSRNAGDPEKERYFAYMIESVLILENGMVLPLLTETLENGESLDGNGKQDCEQNAFKRLSKRIAKLFGKGSATVVLDGLYASGPVVSICKNYGWEYMITLKSECLKSVWTEFDGLQKIEPENTHLDHFGGRDQEYHWSNGIEYTYGNNHKRLLLNVVTCRETWYEESKIKGKPEQKVAKFAWLSSTKAVVGNVVELCMIARKRWRIENHFHVLKNQGYGYKHCYSYNWNAMKAYNCLMKVANFINTFILHNQSIEKNTVAEGKKGLIKKVWEYMRLNKVTDYCSDTFVVSNPSVRKINYRKILLKAA
jgi:hypothetical protein